MKNKTNNVTLRNVYAKGILQLLAYDINQQLNNDVDCRIIYEGAMKRLSRLKDNKFTKVVWNEEKKHNIKNNMINKIVEVQDEKDDWVD